MTAKKKPEVKTVKKGKVPKMKSPPKPPKKKTPAKKKPTKAELQIIKTAARKKKSIEDRHKKCEAVVDTIENEGKSLRFSLIKHAPIGAETFYEWRDYLTDEEILSKVVQGANAKRYARACAERRLFLLEEVIDISDDSQGDKKTIMNNQGKLIEIEDKEFTSRSKLKIETRMKYLKMVEPEKYGDKVVLKGDSDNPIEVVTIFKLPENGRNKND